MANYLAEAFKAFDALEEDTFEVSDSGIEQLDGFLDDSSAFDKDTVEVFDLEAENEEDLKDSYVGEAILDCCVCHEKLFKNKEDIIIDEDAQVANVGEECPYCFSVDGFKVLGEVAPLQPKCKDDRKGYIAKRPIEEAMNWTKGEESLNEAASKEAINTVDIAVDNVVDDFMYDISNLAQQIQSLNRGYSASLAAEDDGHPTSVEVNKAFDNLRKALKANLLANSSIEEGWHTGTFTEADFQSYCDHMTAAVDEVVRSIKRMKEEHDDYYFLFDNLIDDLIDSLSSIRDDDPGKEELVIGSEPFEESLNESSTNRVQDLLNIIDKSFEVYEDTSINEAVLNEDNKIRLSAIPGVTRNREEDFTDDGNRFQAYLYKGLVPITYLRADGEVYVTIAFHHLDNINSKEYREFPSYRHANDFNGVSVEDFNLEAFKKNLDAAYDDITTFLGNVEEVEPQQLEDRIKIINNACEEYEEKVKRYINDNALNIMKLSEFKFKELKGYVTTAANRTADYIRNATAASQRSFMSDDIDELKKRISASWNFKYIEDIINSVNESKSIKEDTVKQNGKWVNKGKEGTHGTFKTKKAADAQRKAMFARGFREELKKKLIPESLGSDVDKFQEWVDYDMKRYGRVSKQTQKEVEEAGLEIVKDKYGDYQVIAGRYNESLEEVSIKTNDSKTEVKAEDDGKIVVEVEPKEDCCEEEKEVIKPLSKEDEEKIEDNSEEIEEVDDVSFDELEESFLKKVYSNIDSYKTASIKNKNGKFFVEGIIKFNSGKTKKASFIFESAGKTPRNKYKLIGESIQITPKKNAFRILGSKVGNKFVSESMNYDYRTKNLEESLRVNGRVARVLGEDIDLTDKKGSITNVLTAHKEELAKASSVKEILGLLSKWFKEEGIDTPASRRLINNVAKKKDITAAQFVVYNSILKGAGQGVI